MDEVTASSEFVATVMRTGDVARTAGIGKATLEHYLRLGLIRPVNIGTQGYRLFDDEALARVRAIRSGRRAGFTLPELGAILGIVPAVEAEELFSTLAPPRCRAELARRGVVIDG